MSRARAVSIDLATKRFGDIGVCVLERDSRGIRAEFVALADDAREAPTAGRVAGLCAELAGSRRAELLLLDGPQAWKHPDNPSAHSRACDRAVHAPAKVGAPGDVKPQPYTAFVAFSIAVFDALHARGWPRLASARGVKGRAVEVFPHLAWKRLGMTPLPAKKKCTPQQLRANHRELCERFAIETNRAPSHDELQALIAGIAGLALLEGARERYELAGEKPQRVDGIWREGFVLLPTQQAQQAKRAASQRRAE